MVMVILMIIVMTYGSDGDYDYCSNANNIDANDYHIIIIIFFREKGEDSTTTILFGKNEN